MIHYNIIRCYTIKYGNFQEWGPFLDPYIYIFIYIYVYDICLLLSGAPKKGPPSFGNAYMVQVFGFSSASSPD